jgi:hypothetical protein
MDTSEGRGVLRGGLEPQVAMCEGALHLRVGPVTDIYWIARLVPRLRFRSRHLKRVDLVHLAAEGESRVDVSA